MKRLDSAIASGVSPPIMITDDHKNTKQRSAGRKRPRSDDYEVSTPADSRRGSVSPKQTKQEQPVNTLSIAEAAELASMLPTPSEENAPTLFAPMASSTSTPTVNPPLNEIFQRAIQSDEPLPQLFATESENTEIWPFNRRRRTTRTFPTGISGVSGLPIELPPQLERLVPSQGPTYGGVEVTVLGSGFYRGLTCLFGEHPATTVYWNPNTLVCVLPPAAHPGPVVVSFKEHPLVIEGQDVALFTYYDASDQALLELALQVVGLKMTGKLHDAKHIAMRIVQGDQQPSSSSNQHQSSSSQHQYSMDIEQQVMKALETLDAPDIVHANPSGHTLLHLAVMLDYRDLVQALVAKIRPEELDHPDRNGFTALHFACWRGSHLLTKILLKAGANPEATCSLGTALEVAKSNNVIKMLASCTVKPSPSRRPSIKAQYMRRFHSLQETEAVEDDLSMDQNGLGLAIPKSDRRLYMFWVPLLLVTVGLLYFQILGNRTFLTVLWDRIPLRNFGSRIAV
ncbi:uncharacterized protein BYT42DRAFT_413217 [Radiomyces spectabilis]|uniref:uncharacterized protein n=1 Tax=Radiomyces spectabilis TaxID=64574 RepID=UPI00221E4642|nr:uncharacterized protein BYT42DRAFT_413217 [Radiomyces spectabilis]KAI8374611.1 hypothetical protein BYT42DRAFT_413217 [Radiomyces spectabilis]